MSFVDAEGVRLYVEETGSGEPIVFVHELHSDYRGWEAQVRWFSRSHRCITYNARGYPPSEVPGDPSLYGLPFVVHDIANIVQALGISKAHVVGSSMGAYAALHFGLLYPQMASSLVVSGVGSGSPATRTSPVWRRISGSRERFPTRDFGFARTADMPSTWKSLPPSIAWSRISSVPWNAGAGGAEPGRIKFSEGSGAPASCNWCCRFPS